MIFHSLTPFLTPFRARQGLWTTLGLLAVFLVALTLRFGHLAGLQASFEGSHLFSLARGDAAHHWQEAREILDEDFWLRERIPWKGPGYSYFLAGMMQLFGHSPGGLRWPLALLGALNCVGLVLLARRILPAGWSLAAGLVAAFNGVLILFDGELLFPTLLIALNLPVLLLLGRHGTGGPGHAVAGILLGLASLVHPVYLVPAATLALWTARRRLTHGIILALSVALVIAPMFLSNLIVRGQPVLISWNGGINLYAGNQPTFDQYSGNRTNAWQRILQSPVDAGIEQEHERDRLYYGLALQEVLRSPVRSVLTLLNKAVILCSPVEYASNIRLYELREHSPVLAATLGRWGPLYVPFGLWGPAALIGLVLTLRRPTEPLSVALALWSLGLAITVVLAFNTARYRAPLIFFGCIWVARALGTAWRTGRSGQHKRLAMGFGWFVLLVVGMSAIAVPQRGFPLPLEWDEASVLAKRGSFEQAQSWIREALAKAPLDAGLQYAVAGFYARQGQREMERSHLRRMLDLPDPEPDLISIGHHLLAKSYAADGRIDEARREMDAALAVQVDATTWHGLPYYQLGLGPVTACWLRLEAADFELRDGDPTRAAEWMAQVRTDCVIAGRLEEKLLDLEVRSILSGPRLVPSVD